MQIDNSGSITSLVQSTKEGQSSQKTSLLNNKISNQQQNNRNKQGKQTP